MFGIDRNVMAREGTLREGKKVSVNEAQFKECQGIVLDMLSGHNIFAVWWLLRKVRKEAKAERLKAFNVGPRVAGR